MGRKLETAHIRPYNTPMPNRGFRRSHLLALTALTCAVSITYARVLFTPLIPASGDFLAYFAPYWELFNRAARAGRLPLWNDYIFAGAPFQANPQTEVFYPLRWPMLLLSAEKGIVLTAALHGWLAGVFGYFLTRHLLQNRTSDAGYPPAIIPPLIAALILSLNGWVTGLLLHPNQISAYPWLIAAILLWEKRPRPGRWPRWNRPVRRWAVSMTLVWTMSFLAGHTQSFYNAAIIWGLWIAGDVGWRGWRKRRARHSGEGGPRRFGADGWPVALAAVFAAGLTAAVQLLPTLELSGLSYRQGGLAFRDHAALSLPPWRLGFTLLPHYARDLGMALGSEAYGEWLGYVGVAGLLLALLGLRHPNRRLRFLGVFLTLTGLLLAFGAYDPLEYLLYRMVPGWDLFRVPARFLPGAMLGVALLAALGADKLAVQHAPFRHRQAGWGREEAVMAAAALALLGLALLTRPNLPTVAGWITVMLFFALLLRRGRRAPTPRLLALLPLILFAELYLASYVLPIQHPTAPQALRSWRTAPARIAAEQENAPHDAACRTVSLSAATWDPGDLGDLKRIYGAYFDKQAFTDLINATKAKEVVAPNLGVIFDIPSLDGFGGGVLPTARFVRAMSLFLPPENIVADGRLQEQLHTIPDIELLSLFNVCYVIADKNFDVWRDDIYYDLAFGETLDASRPDLVITETPIFPASGVGVVSHLSPEAASLPVGEAVAQVAIILDDGSAVTLPLRAGVETAVGLDANRPRTQAGLPAVRWAHDAPGQDAIAELDIPGEDLPANLAARRIREVRFHLLRDDVRLFIRGLAIYDRASGSHATPPVTRERWRRIHSGDVKIYRNDAVLPQIFAVERIQVVGDEAEAVTAMQSPDFEPAHTAILEQAFARPLPQDETLAPVDIQIIEQTPELVRLRYRAAGDAFIVMADAWHPGWRAFLDPGRADAQTLDPLPADIFLRGIALPAGEHDLTLLFRPRSLQRGAWLSLMALAALVILWFPPHRQR